MDQLSECSSDDDSEGIGLGFGNLYDEDPIDTPDGEPTRSSTLPFTAREGQLSVRNSNTVSRSSRTSAVLTALEENNCCRRLMNTFTKLKTLYQNYYKIIRMAITSIIVCTIDTGSDVWTAISHYQRCNWWWGSLTVGSIILAYSWIGYYLLNNEMLKHEDFKERRIRKILWVCLVLQILVPIWFAWKIRTWLRKIKEKKNQKKKLNKRILHKDMNRLKTVKAKEGLLEGGLQLALQSYVLMRKINNYMDRDYCPSECNLSETMTTSNPNVIIGTSNPTTIMGTINPNETMDMSSENVTTSMVDIRISIDRFSEQTCIDPIQIVGIGFSLLAVSYSQAFIYHRHPLWRKVLKFCTYIILISIRMFIPAVLGAFGRRPTWFLAPISSLICYSILFYTRKHYTKKGYTLPMMLKFENQPGNHAYDAILARKPNVVVYWGLNHMLFNVSSVSGLAISFPYMICILPFVLVGEEKDICFYYLAMGLSVICVFVNVIFVGCFRKFGKKIISFSADP